MEDKIAYEDLIKGLQDPVNPLFGGSLAYISIEMNLSMVIKLMKIKLGKPSDSSSFYQNTVLLCSSIIPFAHKMITEDGEIFAKLRNKDGTVNKDEIVNDIFPKSLAFLSNLSLVCSFLDTLIENTSTSLKNDYIMIKNNLFSSFINLASILTFEVNKMADLTTRDNYIQKIEDAVMKQKLQDLKGESSK